MAEPVNSISLGRVRLSRYVAIETLMYLEFNRSLEFLFSTNRQLRSFLQQNYPIINRSFENEGLAIKHIDMSESKRIYGTLKLLDQVCNKTASKRLDN